MDDRRSEWRKLCADLVEVMWRAEAGSWTVTANLEDISSAGVCLLLPCELAPGQRVEMRLWEVLPGTVRHSQPSVLGWVTGIQFDEGSAWDEERFPPKHLFDARTLMERPRGTPR